LQALMRLAQRRGVGDERLGVRDRHLGIRRRIDLRWCGHTPSSGAAKWKREDNVEALRAQLRQRYQREFEAGASSSRNGL
jgi:hypothetical protein